MFSDFHNRNEYNMQIKRTFAYIYIYIYISLAFPVLYWLFFSPQRPRVGPLANTYCNENEEPSVLDGFPDINKTWTDILADPFNVSLKTL